MGKDGQSEVIEERGGAGEVGEYRRGAEGGKNPSPVSLYKRETPIPEKRECQRGAEPLFKIIPLPLEGKGTKGIG